jgi:hypothetical protein
MMTSMFANSVSAAAVLPPVAEDMSAWIIAGAVASKQEDTEYSTASRTPAQRKVA